MPASRPARRARPTRAGARRLVVAVATFLHRALVPPVVDVDPDGANRPYRLDRGVFTR